MKESLPKMAAVLLRQYGDILTNAERDEIYAAVPDLRKIAQYTYELGAPFNARETELLSRVIDNMPGGYDFNKDGDIWRDDILDKYADFIHNYEYTYNEESHKVDPSIDLEQHHVGPMAQDLEKVNEAVVITDEESGYKTVDTGRLAMMNAGAIADLARKVEDLEDSDE